MKAIDRILEYIEYKGLKPTSFEKKVGLSNGYLGIQKKRNADLGEGVILKIIDYCQDLSAEWLISGKGKMLIDSSAPYERIANRADRDKGIPLIPLEAMAGFCAGNSQQVMEYDCEYYSVPMFKGADFLIPVKGDSMIPRYYSGDIVACKRLSLDTFFQWNRVYVIDSEQGVLMKRVQRGSDGEHIRLVSENKDYGDFELHRSEIYSLGLVIGLIRAE